MIHSLRFRLLVMVAAVLAIALGAVAFFSGRAVSVELRKSLDPEVRPLDLEAVARELTADRLRGGSWDGAPAILTAAGRRLQRELLLVDSGGRLVAATSPYTDVTVTEEGRRFRAVRRSPGGAGEIVLVDPYRQALVLPGGAPLGMLFAIPPPPGERLGPINRVWRTLLLAALAAGTVGLLLSFAISRRILRPVEALTAAARGMEGGDLDQRVEVPGKDEIGDLARAFNAMAERRATAERLRRDLVSDVAHELRSPLTNLRCQIEALEDGLVQPTPETLGSLSEEVTLLERLIDDLQDLALAEAGQLELERGPVDLAGEVDRVVKALRRRMDEGGLRVEVDLPPDLPAVDADARRLAQILRNLLGNAITHTPPDGTIRVRGRVEGKEVEVTVEDTGPGIPREHLPFLFERFYRTDASRTRTTGGAGLGLAIVKQLAAAHGGRVWVESEEGRGSAFRFSLPVS